MLPDRVSIPGPLTYESGALPIALRGPASKFEKKKKKKKKTKGSARKVGSVGLANLRPNLYGNLSCMELDELEV